MFHDMNYEIQKWSRLQRSTYQFTVLTPLYTNFTTQLTLRVTFLMICREYHCLPRLFFAKNFDKVALHSFSFYFWHFVFAFVYFFLYQKLQKSKKCYYFKMAPRSIFLRLLCTFQMQLAERRHNMRNFWVQIWKFWLIPSILNIKCS